MKFAVFVALSCILCVCLAGEPKLRTWGNVAGRILGTENVVVTSSFMQVKTHTFTYPKGYSQYPINGIKHWDYKSNPVNVIFLKGDIGQREITFKIESQRNHGINSTFIFYT